MEELAQLLGLDPAALAGTVARFNALAEKGEDTDFGKGGNAYNRYLGDPTVSDGNPCLGPITKAPFYAVRVYPGDIGTAGGMITDRHARVLDGNGRVIPGLYACGNDANSVMASEYPGAGCQVGAGLTFGYVAARHVATWHDTTRHDTTKEIA